MYKRWIRPLLFRLPPETAHDLALWVMERTQGAAAYLPRRLEPNDERLQQTIWGIPFRNPIGLAGGFDKNARCIQWWDSLGFAFAEIGTVTPRPQSGNPKPRLFRYPEEQALVNRMGFNNQGADRIRSRLEAASNSANHKRCVLGVSIGKQKETPAHDLHAVIADYEYTLEQLHPFADYFAVNVSSPNTRDLRTLQERNSLEALLRALIHKLNDLAAAQNQNPVKRKPLCVKIAPDITSAQIEDIADVVLNNRIDGIIATNTSNQTANRETGGLSGAPLRQRATEVIHAFAQYTQAQVPIIGCGGIFTAQDAVEKLHAGAWLLQIYTGFVYEGPAMAGRLNRSLSQYLQDHHLDSIQQMRTHL